MNTAQGNEGPNDQQEPIGVVDIGSNSVRLLIYDRVSRNPIPLFNEKVLCGLGRSVASTGKLSEESITSALNALRRFRALATQVGVDKLHAIATAAARDAKNAHEFVDPATDICGGPISILTGKDEAKYAALGILAGFNEPDGISGDLGGGSLELTDIKKSKLGKLVTMPVGGLRLIDVSGGDIKKAVKFVDEELAKVSWVKNGKDRPFYAIGGTWRALAKLHMAQQDYPLRVTHGYKMATSTAVEFANLLQKQSATSLDGINAISKQRRETVPFGAVVLERLLTIMEPSEVIISANGVREGLIYSLLGKEEQHADPLLTASAEIAKLSAKSSHYCQELCDWTDSLFNTCGIEETAEDKRMRYAACLLSDVGWRVHPEYRADHSLNTIAQANLTGVDHQGRVFIGLSVYFRYGGSEKRDPPILLSLVDEKVLERARILGAAFRLAHSISAGTPGVIYNTPLRQKGKRLVIDLSPPYNILFGEKLQRRAESLGSLIDREVEIETGENVSELEVLAKA